MPGSALFVGLLLVMALALAATLRFRARFRGQASGRQGPEDWDAERERKRWIETTPELGAVYRKLHFDPELEAECERRLRQLKGLIRVDLPDYRAFRSVLEQIRKELETGKAPELDPRDDTLLQEVLDALEEPRRVIEILERQPVDALLPFVERIPLHREGKLIWKTPMEIKLIVKRPGDPERFRERVDELARLLRRSKLRRKDSVKEAALTAIAGLRRDLKRDRAYLPTSLQQLEAKLSDWLFPTHPPAAVEKRRELDSLIRGVLDVRHRFGERLDSGHRLEGAQREELQDLVQRHARQYVGSPWMHTPALTTAVLRNLLDSELAPSPDAPARRRGAPPRVLRLVSKEVGTGHYDSEENIRRLREIEGKGFFVHSLNYALLRMNKPALAQRSSGGARARTVGI